MPSLRTIRTFSRFVYAYTFPSMHDFLPILIKQVANTAKEYERLENAKFEHVDDDWLCWYCWQCWCWRQRVLHASAFAKPSKKTGVSLHTELVRVEPTTIALPRPRRWLGRLSVRNLIRARTNKNTKHKHTRPASRVDRKLENVFYSCEWRDPPVRSNSNRTFAILNQHYNRNARSVNVGSGNDAGRIYYSIRSGARNRESAMSSWPNV